MPVNSDLRERIEEVDKDVSFLTRIVEKLALDIQGASRVDDASPEELI